MSLRRFLQEVRAIINAERKVPEVTVKQDVIDLFPAGRVPDLPAEVVTDEAAGNATSTQGVQERVALPRAGGSTPLTSTEACPRAWYVCFCQKNGKGVYNGMQPMGGHLMRVAFTCEHGAVWGIDVTKEEAQKLRPADPVVETKEE